MSEIREHGEALFASFGRLLDDIPRDAAGHPSDLRTWVRLAERWRIADELRRCGGNRSAAARALGIGRRTLYAKLGKRARALPSRSEAAYAGEDAP